MSRPSLADPPTVDELAELVARVATKTPVAVPSLLWLIVRSSAAVGMLRAIEPAGVHLVAIAHEPGGRALISSSRAGRDRLARWTTTAAALDDVLPLGDVFLSPAGDRSRDEDTTK